METLTIEDARKWHASLTKKIDDYRHNAYGNIIGPPAALRQLMLETESQQLLISLKKEVAELEAQFSLEQDIP